MMMMMTMISRGLSAVGASLGEASSAVYPINRPTSTVRPAISRRMLSGSCPTPISSGKETA